MLSEVTLQSGFSFHSHGFDFLTSKKVPQDHTFIVFSQNYKKSIKMIVSKVYCLIKV